MKQTILWKSHMLPIVWVWKHRFCSDTERPDGSFIFFSLLANQIRDKKFSATNTIAFFTRVFLFRPSSFIIVSLSLPPCSPLSLSLSPFFFSIFHALFCRNLTSTRRPQCRKRKYLYQRVAAFALYCIISDTRAGHINSTNWFSMGPYAMKVEREKKKKRTLVLCILQEMNPSVELVCIAFLKIVSKMCTTRHVFF